MIVLPYRNRSRFRGFGPYRATRTATVTPAGGVSGEGDIMNTGMNWSLTGGDVLFEGNIHNNDGRDGVDG